MSSKPSAAKSAANMSKQKQTPGPTGNKRKKMIVGVVMGLLVVLNLIPFSYTRTLHCPNYNYFKPGYTTVTQQIHRLGLPFAYWQHKSDDCPGPELSLDTNHTTFSGAALFWDLSILGLLSVGLGALVNTKRVAP